MNDIWYIIINPTSGNGIANKKWNAVVTSLNCYNIYYDFVFSKYQNNEQKLVYEALKKGYRKFICVGGDGTLHQIVNGIMNQNIIDKSAIKLAIIPMGTGNDWVKTYKIPKNINKAIEIIKNENYIIQDIGYLEVLNSKKSIYFNNLVGLGFDGFVIKNVLKYKKYGAFSYLIGALTSFINYKKSDITIEFNNQVINTKILLTLVGICSYSGGGMKLTKRANPTDGLFDISIAKNFNLFSLLINIRKFYSGKILEHPEVKSYKTKYIKITSTNQNTFIQADGELIGIGGFKASIIPKVLCFIVP